ncbi:hypothetical protein ACJZ2D_015732 [Fusarium nematophilum]
MLPELDKYVVIGAGVIGLTTALELKRRIPLAEVTVLAREVPGDAAPTYSSAWAGANWVSCATDNGPQEDWDRTTYLMFDQLARTRPECGVERMDLRSIYDEDIDKVNILSQGTGKIWYDELVGGVRYLDPGDLPVGGKFGFDISTFIVNMQKYLFWLQAELARLGVVVRRAVIDGLDDIPWRVPGVSAISNCTGLGAFSLGGVEDKDVYPSKGQVYLVEAPPQGISRMYFRPVQRLGSSNNHIFPRGKDGGVILGGCKIDGDWSEELDPMIGEGIKQRCCALVPELGKPEDLRILKQGVGLRPCRKGGPRIEKERKNVVTVIHNYGAAGAGYQASWGMAKAAVDLLSPFSRL